MSGVDLWGEPVPDAAPARVESANDAYERRRRRARELAHQRVLAGNPLLQRFGPGPAGNMCKTCVHLYAKRFAGTYWKCELRGDTGGPSTDHRVKWPACARFEAAAAGGG